jgi:hypothetical protein
MGLLRSAEKKEDHRGHDTRTTAWRDAHEIVAGGSSVNQAGE